MSGIKRKRGLDSSDESRSVRFTFLSRCVILGYYVTVTRTSIKNARSTRSHRHRKMSGMARGPRMAMRWTLQKRRRKRKKSNQVPSPNQAFGVEVLIENTNWICVSWSKLQFGYIRSIRFIWNINPETRRIRSRIQRWLRCRSPGRCRRSRKVGRADRGPAWADSFRASWEARGAQETLGNWKGRSETRFEV